MSRKKNREYKDYIEDIYNDLIKVQEFTQGLSFDDFMNDVRTQYAVCKALENMGEASKRIPESIRRKFSQIPFKQMAGLRDVVTHDYDGVSYDMIWQVIIQDLPPLKYIFKIFYYKTCRGMRCLTLGLFFIAWDEEQVLYLCKSQIARTTRRISYYSIFHRERAYLLN